MITALIPLPVFYNPNERGERQPVEEEKLIATGEDVSRLFGGGVIHRFRTGTAEGFWVNRGVIHQDTLAFLEVDIEDSAAARERLRAYARDVLKERFCQDAIYIRFVGPIEALTVTEEQV